MTRQVNKLGKSKMFTNFTTITGRQIKVIANVSKRTFTIKTESGKYRSIQLPSQEFNSARRFWTGNDWDNFLKSTNDYYSIK